MLQSRGQHVSGSGLRTSSSRVLWELLGKEDLGLCRLCGHSVVVCRGPGTLSIVTRSPADPVLPRPGRWWPRAAAARTEVVGSPGLGFSCS